MPEPIQISSDVLSRVSMAAQKTFVKNTRPKIGFPTNPLLELAEEIKEGHEISGTDGEIIDGVTTMPELSSQFWRGDDTIIDPQDINGDIAFATQYWRHVMPIRFRHDEWLQKGWDIVPHMPGSIEERAKKIGKASLQKLHDDLLQHEMGKANARFNDNQEIALWRQGSTSKDPVGINAQLPIVATGMLYGQDRALIPEMRHLVQASTGGSGGTMTNDLRRIMRILNERAANCGMTGEWVCLAGSDYLEAYVSTTKADGFQWNADVSGVKKVDSVILDKNLTIGGVQPRYAPTLERLDTLATSERGNAISAVTVTFSGGGATRQATGLVLVNAAGQIADIIITDPGAGYTSQPTATLGNVGGGSGAVLSCTFFRASAATGAVVVAADDFRIGRLADVAITTAGSGYTAGAVIPFAKRAYWIFKPGMKYRIGRGGNGPIERRITVPADPARSRSTEVQMETVGYWYNRTPHLCCLHYISN
jgi:hypothetical protein